MKIGYFFYVVFGFVFFLYSCNDKTVTPTPETPINPYDTLAQFSGLVVPVQGSITLNLSYFFKGEKLAFATKNYTNAAGDTFTINELRHYLTHVTLTDSKGGKVNLKNYHLLDAKVPSSHSITLTQVPAGHYTNLAFFLGVDPANNHSGLQEGALDPAWGMFWTWSTGYIFYRINGNTTKSKSFSFDLGGDNNLPEVINSLNSFKVKSAHAKFNLNMEVNEMFQNPQVFDFEKDGYTIHSDTDPQANKLASNMKDMVTIESIIP